MFYKAVILDVIHFDKPNKGCSLMLHISVSKELFEDISTTKEKVIHKEMTKHWKKELLDIKIVDDKIKYEIKKIDQIKVSNGLGDDKPTLIIECETIDYNGKKDTFDINLGRIIERRNSFITEDYKDSLIEQLMREKEALRDSMNKDHLTNVYNRRKMEEDLDAFINQRNASSLSAIFVDADRFKGINDNFGHDVGDKALQYLAKKIERHAQLLNGVAYRYGGEEFIMLCFSPKEFLLNGLERLRNDIKRESIYTPKKDISLTVSMGVAFYNESKSKEDLLKKADRGVYQAKDEGRDKIVIIN